MLTVLSLVGVTIGLILFLNLLSAKDTAKDLARSVTKKPDDDGKKLPPRGDPSRIYRNDWEGPRPRICPLCGTLLSQEDYLIAALEPEPGTERKRQAHIYGCPYCITSGGVNLNKEKGMRMDTIDP